VMETGTRNLFSCLVERQSEQVISSRKKNRWIWKENLRVNVPTQLAKLIYFLIYLILPPNSLHADYFKNS
jgi:hypothetical protein